MLTNNIIYKLYSLLESQFANWEYTPPIDNKQQLMYDFYTLINLKNPSMILSKDEYNKKYKNPNDIKNMGNENLNFVLEYTLDNLTKVLKKEFLAEIPFCVAAEFRHIYSTNNNTTILNYFKEKFGSSGKSFIKKYTMNYDIRNGDKAWSLDLNRKERQEELDRIKKFPTESKRGYLNSYLAIRKAIKDLNLSWDDFMTYAEGAFNDLKWSTSYGGPAWGKIAYTYHNIVKANTLDERIIWIDMTYHLQHNTGSVFNKLTKYNINGYDWIKRTLDLKADIENIKDYKILIDKSSLDVQQFVYSYLKQTYDITKEDIETPKTIINKDISTNININNYLKDVPYDQDTWNRWKNLKDGENKFEHFIINKNDNSTFINILNYEGKLHNTNGPARESYYENGQLWIKEYWINGELHNPNGPAYESYYDNGQLWHKSYYLNNKELTEEEWKKQTKNTNSVTETENKDINNYLKDVPYDQDTLNRWKNLKDGDNKFEHFIINKNDNDNVIRILNYEGKLHNPNGPAREKYHKNGQLYYKEYWINGLLHNTNGPAKVYYYRNGQLYFKSYYLNGKSHNPNGPAYERYHENGQLEYKQYWINGKSLTEEEWKKQTKNTNNESRIINNTLYKMIIDLL